jgi:ribonuclease Y
LVVSLFIVGGGLALILWNFALKRKSQRILNEAKTEAEVIKKDKILQAKEKFFQLKSEHEKYINEKNNKLAQSENKFKQRENSLSQKIEEAQRAKREQEAIRENLNAQLEIVEKKSTELDKMHKQQVEQLEAISGLSGEEAKAQLIESLKDEAKSEAVSYVNEIMDEAKMTANREAKKVVIETIQRVATETAIENAVTVF